MSDPLIPLAHKIMAIWQDRSRKVFPDYAHARVPLDNPEKSLTFRYCYKLARETSTILAPEDYPLYVRAQLEVLKAIANSGRHPLIGPHCLTGEQAWKRWKLWKRKYDALVLGRPEVQSAALFKVLTAIQSSAEFLTRTVGKLDAEIASQTVDNKNLKRWVQAGKVSPYYLVLSPSYSALDLSDACPFDLDVYRQALTEEIRAKVAELLGPLA